MAPRLVRTGILAELWTAPRRSGLHRAVLQVHLWIGVLLGLYTVLIGLTGSALVFRDQLTRAAQPALFRPLTQAATPPAIQASLDVVLAAAGRANPGFHPLGIQDPETPGTTPSILLQGTAQGSGEAPTRFVHFDPSTGTLLGSVDQTAGFLGWCERLHVYLLAGDRGYAVNGLFGAAFAILCLTGWLLWWPGVRSIVRALRIHWRARLPRLTWDLHTAGGFWLNPALFAIVLSGVFLVFPRPFLLPLALLSGGSRATVDASQATPVATSPPATPALSVDQAYRRARRVLPPSNTIGYLGLPSPADPSTVFDLLGYPPHHALYSLPIHVFLDPRSGTVLAIRDTRSLAWGLRLATYAYAIHFGNFAGLLSQILWFLLGLSPTLLLLTGLLMWWRRSLRATLLHRLRRRA